MKTLIREIREDSAGIREENKVLRKELAAVREMMRGREENDRRRRQIGWMIEERWNKEKIRSIMYCNWNRGNKWKYREGVEEWLEKEVGVKVNVREAFKINKDQIR
jgi:hypothetical protein